MPQTFVLPRQVTHADGKVAAGAIARFFRTGTTTPQPVYLDAALEAPTISVQADSAGMLPRVYLDPGATFEYRVSIETYAGALIYQEDNISRFEITRAEIGGTLYPRTEAEAAGGVTPLDYGYAPGELQRYGNVGQGDSTTDTTAFTNALLSGHLIRLRKLAIAYRFTGPILVPSDTSIWCDPGVSVVMPDGGLTADIGWIRFRDVENCVVYGNGSTWEFATKPVADEQRHVFDIRGSTNITIRDTRVSKSGGDGYYVGAGALNNYSANIYLENIQADNCRRQGLSIVSAINCWVNGALFENIAGTSPEAGVDIEPSAITHELRGIRLTNVMTQDCSGPGIKAVINDLIVDYPVDVLIEGHHDIGSQNAFNPQYGTQMTGRIVYRDCYSKHAQGSGAFVRGWRSISCPILIENFTCDDPNQANDTTNAYNGHAVSIFSTGSDSADDIGNIDIVGLRARDRRGSPLMKSAVYARNSIALGTSSKVRVIRPYEIEGHTEQAVELKFTDDFVLDDPYELTRRDYTTDDTYSTSSQHSLITNAGAAGAVTISLDSNCPVGDRIRCRVEAAQEFRIDPDGASSLLPGGGAGVRIANNVIGSEITICRKSATVWYIERSVGIWTFSDGTESANSGFLEGSNTWDPASVADGDVVSRTITVTGAALGDFALASFSLDTGGLALAAEVTSADTVTARLLNNTGGAVDLGSGTVRARVFRRAL